MDREKTRPHSGHRGRLKKKFTEQGFAALDDKELMELILTYSIQRKDVFPLARDLIHKFGSFEGVLGADPRELRTDSRISEHTLLLLKLMNGVMNGSGRYIKYRRERLTNIVSTVKYCHRALKDFTEEVVMILLLGADDYVEELTKVSYGSGTAAVMPVDRIREIVKRSGYHRVIAAHNHPSGNASPSSEDLIATVALQEALSSIGCALLEHIVVAENSCTALLHHQTLAVNEVKDDLPWLEAVDGDERMVISEF